MPIRVALVYDDLASLQACPDDPLDVGSEWEDERTVAGQAEALAANGFEVTRLPYDAEFLDRLRKWAPDVVFNIAEGRRGKDRESIVPAACRLLGIACTSSDAVAMGLSLDKSLCKAVARAYGIPTADWRLVRRADDLDHFSLPLPVFVKPNFEGSSMGIRPSSLVREAADLAPQVRWVLEHIGPALVETALPGAEYTVGLLGDETLTALPVAEIRTHGRIYDKSMKSKDKLEEEILVPAELDPAVAARLVRDSRRLFVELGLGGLARFDFKADAQGEPQFMEVNPLPGLSRYYSVFTIQAQAAGIAYTDLLGRLVRYALAAQSHLATPLRL